MTVLQKEDAGQWCVSTCKVFHQYCDPPGLHCLSAASKLCSTLSNPNCTMGCTSALKIMSSKKWRWNKSLFRSAKKIIGAWCSFLAQWAKYQTYLKQSKLNIMVKTTTTKGSVGVSGFIDTKRSNALLVTAKPPAVMVQIITAILTKTTGVSAAAQCRPVCLIAQYLYSIGIMDPKIRACELKNRRACQSSTVKDSKQRRESRSSSFLSLQNLNLKKSSRSSWENVFIESWMMAFHGPWITNVCTWFM